MYKTCFVKNKKEENFNSFFGKKNKKLYDTSEKKKGENVFKCVRST
jgi:hypothetical protein